MKLLKLDSQNRVRALAISPDDLGPPADFWDLVVSNETEVEIGWTKLPDGTFTPPAASTVRNVSRREFARLFTPQERIAIRAASASNPQLADLYELMTLDETVNLAHPDVSLGIGALVSAGLLTQARGAAILAGTAPA